MLYLHSQGVIHRDISPNNIILTSKTGLSVLIDVEAVRSVIVNIATSGFLQQPSTSKTLSKRIL
ncbi:MAG: hypothetical protein GC195_11405 [Nostoc sp. RI_552]|nr:hypothetical protein [Nostoc sp. RI_552]